MLMENNVKAGFILALVCAMTLSFSISGEAATLSDYQRRLDTVSQSLRGMSAADDEPKAATDRTRRLTAYIRSLIPKNENIELPGGTITTDNAWLWDALTALDAEHRRHESDELLRRLAERLESVRHTVDDLSAAATAGQHTKDEDKRRLAEILQREEYRPPERTEESLFQRWSRAILEWLARMFPRVSIPTQDPSGVSSLSVVLQGLLYLALAAGLGYLIYRIFPFITRRSRSGKADRTDERVILGELIASHISSRDVFAEAERLAREGQFRHAVRKAYIALLCELNDRRVIALARHKTNRDYVRDLKARRDLLENVGRMTGEFERHWYGSAPTINNDWEAFRSRYLDTVANI